MVFNVRKLAQPLLGVLNEHAAQQILQVFQLRSEHLEVRAALHDFLHHFARVFREERRKAYYHFINETAKCPDVMFFSERLSFEDFRGRIVNRTNEAVSRRLDPTDLTIFINGKTKVPQLGVSLLVNEYIFRF